MQKKTRRPVQFEIREPTREAVGAWIAAARLKMRRTKPTLIYRRTRNRRAVQLLLGHNKLEHRALPRN